MLNVFFMKADAYYMDLIIKLSKMNIDYIRIKQICFFRRLSFSSAILRKYYFYIAS